jgi:hypothetical protein
MVPGDLCVSVSVPLATRIETSLAFFSMRACRRVKPNQPYPTQGRCFFLVSFHFPPQKWRFYFYFIAGKKLLYFP